MEGNIRMAEITARERGKDRGKNRKKKQCKDWNDKTAGLASLGGIGKEGLNAPAD